jgi:hypothetical protein
LQNGAGAFPVIEIKNGEDIVLPTDKPAKKGYDFAGWRIGAADRGETYSAGSTIGPLFGDTVLFAVWTPQKKPVSVFLASAVTLARKDTTDTVFKNAVARYGKPLTFRSSNGKIDVNPDGSYSFRFAAVGKTTVTAYDGEAPIESVEVTVEWSIGQWLLVIFLFGWLYL